MELQPWIHVYMVGNERRSQALELKGRASAFDTSSALSRALVMEVPRAIRGWRLREAELTARYVAESFIVIRSSQEPQCRRTPSGRLR